MKDPRAPGQQLTFDDALQFRARRGRPRKPVDARERAGVIVQICPGCSEPVETDMERVAKGMEQVSGLASTITDGKPVLLSEPRSDSICTPSTWERPAGRMSVCLYSSSPWFSRI